MGCKKGEVCSDFLISCVAAAQKVIQSNKIEDIGGRKSYKRKQLETLRLKCPESIQVEVSSLQMNRRRNCRSLDWHLIWQSLVKFRDVRMANVSQTEHGQGYRKTHGKFQPSGDGQKEFSGPKPRSKVHLSKWSI